MFFCRERCNLQRKILFLAGLIVLAILTSVFVYNDDFLYESEILKIEKITTADTSSSFNSLGLEEKYYDRVITGTITNGKNRGETRKFHYEETYSSVVTDKYQIGDKVFIVNDEIEGLKRDFYLVSLVLVFIVLIVLVGEIQGFLAVGSVVLNIVVFYLGLSLYFRGINLLLLCVIESIIFSILSLFIAGGINKKTISAIISVVTSTIILLVGIIVVSKVTNYGGVNFNELNFLTVPPEDIIVPELLIGTLGAIMDVAITISAAIAELIEKDKDISVKNLKRSAKQIGKDIMSTMSNVLFFTYLCGGLPIFVLAIRNGFSVYNYVVTNFSLELTRFLVGSIGIIMTIPITMYICVRVFRGREYE